MAAPYGVEYSEANCDVTDTFLEPPLQAFRLLKMDGLVSRVWCAGMGEEEEEGEEEEMGEEGELD